MSKLTSKQRNAIPSKSFALPGRRYPIEDASHARNALARVSQHGSSARESQSARCRASSLSRHQDGKLGFAEGEMNSIITDYGERQFRPLHDRLLVRRLPDAISSVLYIPDVARENSKRAEVVCVGLKCSGDVQVGDVVMVPGAASKYPDWERSDLMMIREADIGGIYTESGA